MKIVEINSEQWEINESGLGTITVGAVFLVGGLGAIGWVVTHLVTIAWWWGLVALGIVMIGGVIIFSSSKRQIVLRRQGLSDIVTTKIIGGKQSRQSFDRSQIMSVNLDTSDELRTHTDSDGDKTTTRERISTLYLLLNDNSEVVLATDRGGNNGISINGLNMNGVIKAPLADEAQRIAAFYGVPLSSRANNVSSLEAITGIVSAVKQGVISTPIQTVSITDSPQQVQLPTQPSTMAVPAQESVSPAASMQGTPQSAQVLTSDPADPSVQPHRQSN
jgi:hypothetical protein